MKSIKLNYGQVILEPTTDPAQEVFFLSFRLGNSIALTADDANLVADELRAMAASITSHKVDAKVQESN